MVTVSTEERSQCSYHRHITRWWDDTWHS